MNKSVKLSALTHPFSSERKLLEFKEGATIRDMIVTAQPDTAKLRHAIVFINGKMIPRSAWATHTPKAGELVEARACAVPFGGGDDGGKNVLRIVLTIAVIALSVFLGPEIAPFLLPPTASAATVATVSAIASAVVASAGMLAVNSLCAVKPASLASLSGTQGTTDSASLFLEGTSNSLKPFSPVPVVLGKHRMTPPLGSKPYTEMIGDDQYFRMLFVWGIGPISIDLTSLKIGDTLLTNFTDYQIEHREGYSTDLPLTLFPDAVSEENFTAALTQAAGWLTRTTTVNADEISLDILFNGLVQFDETGNKQSRAVNVEIEYRKTYTEGDWLKIDTTDPKFKTSFDSSWLNITSGDLDSITFTGKKAAALRFGIRWGVEERAQYDVRVRRTTVDTSSTLISDLTYWTALRSIKIESPVDSSVPLAMTALVIKATDQFNGIVDDFSGVVTRVCNDWDADTGTWIERVSQNPASLFRFVLQGNGMAVPLADARIDLTALQDFHEFCTAKGFKFNMVRDYSSSVWDTLRDICAAGRAAPTMVDGKWSVVIDREQTAPVSIITPRNSFDFSAEKFFIDPPHGWRIQFSNEDQDYATDERRVYRDGYSDANASKFETLELLGVTDPDQVFKLGRWRMSQVLNQPERWTFKQDMEYLTYRRGDWVKIAHDVMIVGLATGRVKSVILGDDNAVAGVVLDENCVMEAGKTYGLVIRTLTNPSLTGQVETIAGAQTTLSFTEPIAGIGSPPEAAIAEGDLFCFGELGEETEDAQVISISPNSNLQATVVAVPYRTANYAHEDEEIPAFITKISTAAVIPAPTVRSIVSDETAMVISSTGSLKIRVGITYDPLSSSIFGNGTEFVIQIRQHGTNEPFYPAVIEEQGEGYVYIGDVRSKEVVDIRMRFKVNGKLIPGPWTTVSGYTVVGRSSYPSPLTNMTISAFGAQAMIRWDKPSEIDVLYGGEVAFRHSPLMTGATWGESVSIGQSSLARTLFAVLPLKEGTYLARVYDVDGNPSETITSVTTKQVSVNEFVSVTSLDEAPDFLGTHSGTEVSSNALKLIDGASPVVMSGTYHFAEGIDLGAVSRVRLTTRLTVSIYAVNDLIDSRLSNIDDWADFDGSVISDVDAKVYVRHTDDDPAISAPAWSAWERLDSAEFEARGFEFYVVMDRDNVDYNMLISELGVDVEKLA